MSIIKVKIKNLIVVKLGEKIPVNEALKILRDMLSSL